MIGMKNDEYYILSDKLEITEPENIDLDECIKSALENRFEMTGPPQPFTCRKGSGMLRRVLYKANLLLQAKRA